MKKIWYYLTAAPVGYLVQQFIARLSLHAGIGASRLGEADDLLGYTQWQPCATSSPFLNLRLVRPEQFDDRLALYLGDQYCQHRFDLLGTGWVDSGYAAPPSGLDGHVYSMNLRLPPDLGSGDWLQQVVHANDLAASKALWSLLVEIDPHYQPIDWQRDRKSGFRWSAQESHNRQFRLSRGKAGVDIIQPWELSRLQHLPQLALIAGYLPEHRAKIIREFQCQVLDFAAANPKGMGVNWACTMDVAMRAANLVLAYWLLAAESLYTALGAPFEREFAALIFHHGHFIRHNLEYNAGNSGNHYLANLTGLLFITAFLEPCEQTVEWERLAVRELERESRRQFYADGGHFEGATCYHALCTELLVYGVALASRNRCGLELPDSLHHTVGRARNFLSALVGPTGELVQFGDNDSGRLFRLAPRGSFLTAAEARQRYVSLAGYPVADGEPYFDENLMDYSGITDAFRPGTLAYQLLVELGKQDSFAGHWAPPPPYLAIEAARPALRYSASKHFYSDSDLRAGLRMHCFPDSGIYIAESRALYLAVIAHSNRGQKLNLPHSHNDKLALELYIDGVAVLTDPGSYVYTPLPYMRDQFRSIRAHNTLQVEGLEQNRFVDTFVSYPDARCTLLEFSPHAIELALTYRGVKQRRRIEITDSAVIVIDHCNRPFRQCWNDFALESVGYGKLRRRM